MPTKVVVATGDESLATTVGKGGDGGPEKSGLVTRIRHRHRVGDGPGEGDLGRVAGIVGRGDGHRVAPAVVGVPVMVPVDGSIGEARWQGATVGDGHRGPRGSPRVGTGTGGDGRTRSVGLVTRVDHGHRVGDGPAEGRACRVAGVVGGGDRHREQPGRGRRARDPPRSTGRWPARWVDRWPTRSGWPSDGGVRGRDGDRGRSVPRGWWTGLPGSVIDTTLVIVQVRPAWAE